MADPITYTPSLKLAKPPAGRQNWSELANTNWEAIDAAISSFFVIQNYTGPWSNSTPYVAGDVALDTVLGGLYIAHVAHNSASAPTTFAADRTANPTYWSAYSSAGTSRGVWAPDTVYASGDFVVNGLQYAVCIVAHTSTSSFTDDVTAGKWAILIDFSLIGTQPLPVVTLPDANKFVVVNPTGSGYTIVSGGEAKQLLGGTTVGINLFGATSQLQARQFLGVSAVDPFLTSTSLLFARLAIGAGTMGNLIFVAATASEVNALLGISIGPVNVGSITDHTTAVAPAGYLLCEGQAISRTTYSALFAVIGTTFGSGDGSTTFNVPNVPATIVFKADGTPVVMTKIIRV